MTGRRPVATTRRNAINTNAVAASKSSAVRSTARQSDVVNGITEIVDATLVEIDGQLLLSQSRCIDLLLDLYNATSVAVTRQLIGERLADLRHLNVVEAEDVRADLHALVAIAAAETAIEDAVLAAAEATLGSSFDQPLEAFTVRTAV